MSVRRRIIVIAVAVAVGGCTRGPDYKRPASVPVPAGWRDTAQALRDSSYANIPWWGLVDTTAQRLVRTALRENRDLYVALARVNEARALLGVQRLEAYPQIDVGGGIRRSNGSDSLLSGTSGGTIAFYGADVSWEVDLWGRVRRLNEAARATLLATEQERRAVIMTVVSDVARAYLELRDLDAQAAIAAAQIEVRRASLIVARARFQGGLTSELDVRQGENALAFAEGSLARVLRERTQKENELSVLLGRVPGDIPRGLALADQSVPNEIPAGLPAELLTRRPDIRAAEEQLRAANAHIGAALAAMFPTISLTARGGTASDALQELFTTGTGYWSIATNLLQPIIDKNRNRQQVAAERARTEAAVGRYEKTVLIAFQEVEDGLVAVRRLREEAAAAARAATAARLSVTLARARYEGGVDNYLNLLDAQREQLNAELHESEVRRQHLVAVVQLYKALGGGWDPVTDTLAMPLRNGR